MIRGLTKEQVEQKIANGEVNRSPVQKIKTSDIIKRHTFTLFNILLFILAVLVFFFGNKRDALFIIIAVISTVLAIINDLRAKKMLEKLTLLAKKPATVVREGLELKISPEMVVKGDTIKFSLGDQIVVDSEIIEGELEVNESLISGESDNIKKGVGDRLVSGSFVVSGTGFAKVTAVGNDNFVSKLLLGAKKIQSKRSKLFLVIDKIIKINSIILVPVGILLFLKQYFLVGDLSSATTSTVAALVAMIPEGLVLLTSSVLALAAIRLAKQKVLVQDFYTIETLARVDTICLDKTGTLTTGKMKVEKVVPVDGVKMAEITEVIRQINGTLETENPTATALTKKFGKQKVKADELYHFSSEKKFSGIKVGKTDFLIGAFDFVAKDKELKKQEQAFAQDFRVLTVVKRTKNGTKILGFVLLSDELRKNAKELLEFFKQNEVETKIISGDSLPTIQKVLFLLGISDLKSVDLSLEKNLNYRKLACEYDVFARVKPEQKKHLVEALKTSGRTVAMTGDGVNDVLALKEADCGISVGTGADAARRVADIVLLDDDFASLPSVIFEGRQTVNNVTRSSALFINKTIFATVLSVIFIFLSYRYPFSPIEMSLINSIIIGIPSFILALETNHKKISANFYEHLLKNSVPAALATIFAVISVAVIAGNYNFSWEETTTFSCILTCLIGLLLIYKISRPLNKLRFSLLFGLILALVLVFLIPFVRNFFSLTLPTENILAFLLPISLISVIIFVASSFLATKLAKRWSENA